MLVGGLLSSPLWSSLPAPSPQGSGQPEDRPFQLTGLGGLQAAGFVVVGSLALRARGEGSPSQPSLFPGPAFRGKKRAGVSPTSPLPSLAQSWEG